MTTIETQIGSAHADAASALFWTSLAEGKLVVPRCNACERQFFPPMPACPNCGSRDIAMTAAASEATLYSWATVHRALSAQFVDDVPYTVVVAELRDGGRVVGRLVDGAGVELVGGERLVFEPQRVHGQVVPGFRLAQ